MKRLSIVLISLLMSFSVFSQENHEYQTIFGNNPIKVSGMGGFEMYFSSLGGYFAYGTGGMGAAIFSNSVLFGGYGISYTIDRTFVINNNQFKNMQTSMGGIILGYVHKANRAIHPAAFLQVGWGDLSFNDENTSFSDNFIVLNPSIELEFNITKYFRMAIGGHYQFANGINNAVEIGNSDFSGPGGKLSFRFGRFKG